MRATPFLRSILAPLAALSLLPALGCSSEGSEGTGGGAPHFEYPLDDELRLNHLQLKATHNSYHVQNPDLAGTELAYTHAPLDEQLGKQGVRGFELDTWYDYMEERFEVYHLGAGLDEGTRCRLFVDCLSTLKKWSDQNPAHHAIFVQIEPKESPTEAEAEDYFAHLEGEILSVWPRERVITPDEVRGDAATLRDGVATKGWPTLGATRGRILFYVDNSTDFRRFYTHDQKDLNGRLMFADATPDDPWAGVLLFNDPIADADGLSAAVAAGFIVRTRADDALKPAMTGDTTQREAALASGGQIISTDYPAKVDGTDYVVEIPGGTPSRCNPLTAPADCTSEAIENPEFIRP